MKIIDVVSDINSLMKQVPTAYLDKLKGLHKLRKSIMENYLLDELAPTWMEHAVGKWSIDIKRMKL